MLCHAPNRSATDRSPETSKPAQPGAFDPESGASGPWPSTLARAATTAHPLSSGRARWSCGRMKCQETAKNSWEAKAEAHEKALKTTPDDYCSEWSATLREEQLTAWLAELLGS